MSNSVRPETTTRAWEKCSACRLRKKKCVPHDRDWENSQQKCEFCETHDLPCGPNLRHKDDPATIRHGGVVTQNENAVESIPARAREHLDESAISSAQNVSAPTTRRIVGRNDGPPYPNGIEDGRQSSSASSVEDLEENARSKLHNFHALGNTLAYVSQPSFAYCHAHGSQQPYHDLSIEERLHELFLSIYEIAVGANEIDEPHLARWVLFALVSALDQYPQLFDSRKRHKLLKIALMFQQLGHQATSEHVLLKIAGMYRVSELRSPEGPFRLLATSFSNSSMSVRRVLEDRWNERVGGNYIDANLNVSPLHIAVQHRQPSIIVALLTNPNDWGASQPASSLIMSSDVAELRVKIEERDINGRSALFAAVANGDESCCLALLIHAAAANTRDDYGHTALEVAVRGGNLNIVRHLINFKAEVNPDITGCSSLPLHAAIESGNVRFDIINHLLDAGAKVDLQRYTDNKHAIDLAVDRGLNDLAERMRQMVPNPNPTPFMSIGKIVS